MDSRLARLAHLVKTLSHAPKVVGSIPTLENIRDMNSSVFSVSGCYLGMSMGGGNHLVSSR